MPDALRNSVAKFYKNSLLMLFSRNMQIVGRQDTLKSFNCTMLVASIN